MCTKRIFVGSFIRHEVLNQLFEFSKQRLDNLGLFKWTRTPENFHITFHFFGKMSCDDIERLREIIQHFSQETYDFDLYLKGLDFFIRKRKPSVLYAGLQPSKELFELHQEIQNQLFQAGFITEPQMRFVPHITFARIKKVSSIFSSQLYLINQKYEPLRLNPIKVEIIESVLSPKGALYRGI